MWDLYVLTRHQVAHSLHCGHTLKAPALGGRVQIVEFVALALDAFSIPVSPHRGREQALTSLATTVRLVDVHGVVLLSHTKSYSRNWQD